MFDGRSDVLMNYSELELSEVLYDGLVGGALGLIGSGVEVVQNRNGTETPNVDAGARQAEVEGNFTPEVESSAEGAQSAPAADNQGNGLVGRMRDSLSVLRDEQPVARITGAEIPVGGKIVERLQAFANSFGNKVNRSGFGDVLFSKSRIKNSMIGHGIGQVKIDAFAAVPDVIRNGQEIAHEANWKGRNYDTYIFAAPIDYKGAADYLGVIVTKDSASNRYYVHEVVDANGNVLFESKEAPSPASDGTSALSGDLDHVASGDASTDTVQAPVSLDPTVTQENGGVKGEDMQRGGNYAPSDGLGAADAGFDPFTAAQNEYGTLPSGEKPVRSDDAPRSTNGEDRVSRTVVTAKGAQVTPDEFVPLIENETMKGGFSFIPVSNNDVTQRATARIAEKGWSRALADWTSDVRAGKAGDSITATGALLYNYAVNSGDTGLAPSVLSDYATAVRNSARGLQAARIMKTLTPSNRLYMMEQNIRNLAERLGITDGLHLDKELAQRYLDAQDDAARDKIIEDIQQDVADQIPSTLLDKWTAWRYVNMLGNFKTQGRNIVGNVGMQAVQRAKDGIATALESIAYHASGGKFERTKSFALGKELRDAAKADFKNVQTVALGEGKYHEGGDSDAFLRGVEDKRTIFKNNGDWGTTESSNPFVRAARITTDTAAKGLEGYRRATNWAMEQGDVIFSKGAYANALAGYLKAHQVTAEQFSSAEWQSRNGSFVDKARLYAIKEAQESTFRDSNTLKINGRETPS